MKKQFSFRMLSLCFVLLLLVGAVCPVLAQGAVSDVFPQLLQPGDVDGDSTVTAQDARLALRASVSLENYAPGSAVFFAADADADGEIGAADARMILRASVDLEDPRTWPSYQQYIREHEPQTAEGPSEGEDPIPTELLDDPESYGYLYSIHAGFSFGMTSPENGEIVGVKNRVYSDLIDVSSLDLTQCLARDLNGYETYRYGFACFDAAGKLLRNCGFYTADMLLNVGVKTQCAMIRIVVACNDNRTMAAGEPEAIGREMVLFCERTPYVFPHRGETFSVLGDSISRYDDTYGGAPAGTVGWGNDTCKQGGKMALSQMWWYRLALETGMEICRVNANAGSTVSDFRNLQKTGVEQRLQATADERIDALALDGKAPDHIICMIGINDFNLGVPLGDYNGAAPLDLNDTATFRSAYAVMLQKLHLRYPNAQIYCCTLFCGTVNSNRTFTENLPQVVNKNGTALYEYNNAIRELADIFCCRVIDFASCGFNLQNIADFTFDTSKNQHLHPTAAGMLMLAAEARRSFL